MSQEAAVMLIASEDSLEGALLSDDAGGDMDSGCVESASYCRSNLPPPIPACSRSGVRDSERTPRDPMPKSMLSRYLREMAAYQVMDPYEELQAAQAVERTEIEHWVALLSYLPVAEQVLDQLNADIQSLTEDERPDVPQMESLRELARLRGTQQALTPEQQVYWNDLSRELARAIRLPDLDRLWVANANAVVEDFVREELDAKRQTDTDPSGCWSFLRRVRQTNLAQRRAKHRFVEANLRLVVRIARRYGRGSLPLIDVIQDGNIGLMKAVERFDHTRGFRFSSFALWWIRHAVSRAVDNQGRAVRVPTHLLAAYARASRVTEALVARTGREPTIAELEQQTRIRSTTLDRVRNLQLSTPLSLDREVGDVPGRRFLDLLADDESVDPYECLAQKWWTENVHRLLDTLTRNELRVIRWRFGLDDENELTLGEIAEKYQLSSEAIRRQLERTLRKMRKRMGKCRGRP